MRAGLVGLATVVFLLAGCSGDAPEPGGGPTPEPGRPTPGSGGPTPGTPTAAPPADASAFRCESPIDTLAAPPAAYTSVLDAVALATASVQQVTASGPDDPHPLWAKTGLVIRAGHPVVLTVPETAAIAWGTNGGRWTNRLAIPGCPPTAGDREPWMAYPGGFVVDEPACVPVEVSAGDRRATLRVPVGRAC
ncbi:hypothetical protein [Cryptosporangium aurantiacum]|uniref:Uncharacterized protein n=1 Tax=Cryptosporangium aurantiacum TaxID=134849 RepID=A0A1M7TWM6_9ACTN|nr:hypothetical protein [Cryptosporangium aurantiacum]SHN75112.1 hypothetical protein SAMN05443668_107221 [Cryptosporangium aurantiacum]